MNSELDYLNNITEKRNTLHDYSTPAKLRYILSGCSIGQGENILDVGTSTGLLLPYIAERIGTSGSITAADISSSMLGIARERHSDLIPRVKFLLLDVEHDHISGRFDKIMLYCLYPWIHNPEHTLSRLVHNNLTDGGSVFIAFPTDAGRVNAMCADMASQTEELPSPQELVLMLSSFGLNARVIEDSPRAYIVAVSK